MRLAIALGIISLSFSGISLAQDQGTQGQTTAAATQTTTTTESAMPALKTECKGGNLTRVIWVSYESATTGEGCKVHYSKPDENVEEKVLWSAQQVPNFCQEKAKAFIEKQKGWNFTCTTAN